MKIKLHILMFLMLPLFTAPPAVRAESASEREHKIKAAFVYNFIKFIDWPQEKTPDKNKPITIGVVGSDTFVKAFDPVKNKQVKGRRLAIKRFGDWDKLKESQKKNDSAWKEKLEALKKCRVLFICSCESGKNKVPVEIIKALKGSGVLLVGEVPGFLEKGGVINFVTENKKVRFEVNSTSAKRNKLKIRSQLLKLAKRIYKEEPSEDAKN